MGKTLHAIAFHSIFGNEMRDERIFPRIHGMFFFSGYSQNININFPPFANSRDAFTFVYATPCLVYLAEIFILKLQIKCTMWFSTSNFIEINRNLTFRCRNISWSCDLVWNQHQQQQNIHKQNWEGATNVCIIDFMTQMMYESPNESFALIQIEFKKNWWLKSM